MRIPISNAIFQTEIFAAVFVAALVATVKRRNPFNFDNSLTEEMKGFAMLAIVFSHIGYFLVSDNHFLFPLSIAAGVGVNIFLLLSGYGLTISSINKPLNIKEFYLKRLLKLFMPLWIVLGIFFALDWLVLGQTYSLGYILQSLGGIFLTSNPAADIDSPLWYFTLIFFFYVLFPLIFRKSKPLLSGILILIASWVLLQIPLPLHADNIYLYQLHFLAFPLGVILASIRGYFKPIKHNLLRIGLLILACIIFSYFAIHSEVGQGKFQEQLISIISALLVLAIFLLKGFQMRLFNIFGRFSYEIYLIHWPIMFRLENFYGFLPGSLATILYLVEFVVLGFALQKLSQKITA